MNSEPQTGRDMLRLRAQKLGLYGLLSQWQDFATENWVHTLVDIEEAERARRSLLRRISSAKIGRFKPIADFDWAWPNKIDRSLIEELFKLAFLADATNVIILGPNGMGKTVLAQNLAHHALMNGHVVRMTTAGEMLGELAAQDSPRALDRLIKQYARPDLLVIDEVGYLSYDNHAADLLFQVLAKRYQSKSTVVTTNKPFSEWPSVFPNASCVVALVDRLIHNAELVHIEGTSYRLKEAQERSATRAAKRSATTTRRNGKSASTPAPSP